MVETSTTDLSPNYTDYGYDYTEQDMQYWCITHDYTRVIISGVFIVVCLCGLAGNMVVVWFLGFHMKKNPFTVYVLNLAIADFSLLLFVLGILTVNILSAVECFNWYTYVVSRYKLMVLFFFWYLASMYLLTAMSMERCLSVLFPVWYRSRRPKHLSGIVCGVLWALVAIIASLLLVSCSFHFDRRCSKVLNVLSPLNFLIFCLLPLLSNLTMFFRLRCGSQRRHPGKLYVAVLLSVICMFIFGLPLIILIFIFHFDKHIPTLFIGYLLASLNSSINPLIYFLVGSFWKRHFQGSVKAALRRVFEYKVISEDSRQTSGETAVEITV
ncbi:PREDICTED: mas-related G-protein coupled receptor member H-like [Calidris pugnax]|uniref:mas-related G-protein coupled receptor member H-like n=1 Tax=Calidris pugnax TaxID=198806 RepID=UPI00071CBFC6|nr:PREDICTED: mas-related G-protein coupled receptor member H-like [Calidris pugnax]